MLITFRSLSLDSVSSWLDPFSGKLSLLVSGEERDLNLGFKNKSQTYENLSQVTVFPTPFSPTFTRTVD